MYIGLLFGSSSCMRKFYQIYLSYSVPPILSPSLSVCVCELEYNICRKRERFTILAASRYSLPFPPPPREPLPRQQRMRGGEEEPFFWQIYSPLLPPHTPLHTGGGKIVKTLCCGEFNATFAYVVVRKYLKSVLETFYVGTNSLFTLPKERVRSDLKRLQNRLLLLAGFVHLVILLLSWHRKNRSCNIIYIIIYCYKYNIIVCLIIIAVYYYILGILQNT